jgi:hypothetical protein
VSIFIPCDAGEGCAPRWIIVNRIRERVKGEYRCLLTTAKDGQQSREPYLMTYQQCCIDLERSYVRD